MDTEEKLIRGLKLVVEAFAEMINAKRELSNVAEKDDYACDDVTRRTKTLLTRQELCEHFKGKLSLYTIGDLTRRKLMPFVKIPGVRVYLYDLEEIEKWLDENQRKTKE